MRRRPGTGTRRPRTPAGEGPPIPSPASAAGGEAPALPPDLLLAREVAERAASDDPLAWGAARIAAKEAVRRWLRDRLGRDVHPSPLTLRARRPDRFVVTDAPDLTAAEHTAHLAPPGSTSPYTPTSTAAEVAPREPR